MENTLERTKDLGGRPLKFESPEQLQEMIDEYFETTPQKQWTITGLALALDTSRKVLQEYEDERPRFRNAIKRAKLKVENAYELALRENGKAGDIFALKNFGWRDESSVNFNANVNINHVLLELNGRTERAVKELRLETQPLLPDSEQTPE